MNETPLTQGQVALVDDEDYERVNQLKWHCWLSRDRFYARRSLWVPRDGKRVMTAILMHRFILTIPDNMVVDHINYNTLDNRRSNLRLATHQDNARNVRPFKNKSSAFKGVSWHKASGKWLAAINTGKYEHHHIGIFATEIEAALAYDKLARIHHGEFAVLNFPEVIQ